MGIAHRLTHTQASGLRFDIQRGDDLHVGLFRDHGQRPGVQATRGAHQPFSPKTGKP